MNTDNTNHELTAGLEFGHYRIISKIGVGGMGEVYLAEDTRLGRTVAIKFLNRQYSRDADLVRRFVQEAKAASALNHPHILTVHDVGELNGHQYIVSEFIDGKTLREHISPSQGLPLDTVLKVTIEIADALATAHRAGIIHRDIKPENIILRKDGYAKLLDFGLAKLADPGAENALPSNVHTEPGAVMGTLAYMSPEQARGRRMDSRTDIFSLGVVLYELLTRQQPFLGETRSHAVVAIIEHDPPPLSATGVQFPLDLQRIVSRALEKRPEQRYQKAEQLVADLRSVRKRLSFEEELERTSQLDGADAARTKILPASPHTTEDTDSTIAVLPFVNMSRGEDGDYFSDGLAEEMLNVLSKINGLRVAARTSAFSFKGKQTTIKEIGDALNVASILEGSIRMSGERVRIAVQLVNVTDGYQLWSETYDRQMDDIFAVQDDIARSVVEELRTRLLGGPRTPDTAARVQSEIKKAVVGRAADPEAQRLMLLGRHFLDRTTQDDTTKGIAYFRQALDRDPGYARCWAELGRAYSIEAGRTWVPVSEGFDRSRDATRRALDLEPDLAEGHAQMGRILTTHDWDLKGAEAAYARALELAPGSSPVIDGASVLNYKLGRLDRAMELNKKLLTQDPLSAAFWHNVGLTCHAAGDLPQAEDAFRRSLELVPQRFVSHALLAMVLTEQGRHEEAMDQAMLEPYEMWRMWASSIIHHVAGRPDESNAALDKLVEEYADGNAYQIAEVYSMRRNTDDAFSWLDRAVIERDTGLTHAKVNPRFRSLHPDARWPGLLAKIGFEP